jgi:hypothetical protein
LFSLTALASAPENEPCDYMPETEYLYQGMFDDYPVPINLPMFAANSFVRVSTNGTARGLMPVKGEWVMGEGSYHLDGVGFVIAPGYIVTAAHVVEPKSACYKCDKYGWWCSKVIEVVSKQIYVGEHIYTGSGYAWLNDIPAELFYLDVEHDIAVLKTQEIAFEPLPYPIVPTFIECETCEDGIGGLEKGDALAVVVRQRDENYQWDSSGDFEVRYGEVLSHTIDGCDSILQITWFNMMDFTSDLTVYPGDSGSPVFAFKDGKPVIVGVLRAGKTENPVSMESVYSYICRTDFILQLIDIF